MFLRILLEGGYFILYTRVIINQLADMKKAYYARSIDQYDTKQDEYCIEEIESLGFEVIDPNEFFTQEKYDQKGMDMFFKRIEECDVLFIRGLPGGKITAGVLKEALHAIGENMPVYEIPFGLADRAMTVEETRYHLKLAGVRD